ncbi:hypothetical protein L596_013040 [Steinernema carpocapsae]|uniref:Uncharacterized protein n=1 Tax=Steinernema carpocapsae TaxID=34508 RepID=A0A4V6XWF9_STECR|nr:hypothetical protein L596_013040 [Steinernema carpocapsae]
MTTVTGNLHAQTVDENQDTAFLDKTKPIRIKINQIVKVGELFFGDVVSLYYSNYSIKAWNGQKAIT